MHFFYNTEHEKQLRTEFFADHSQCIALIYLFLNSISMKHFLIPALLLIVVSSCNNGTDQNEPQALTTIPAPAQLGFTLLNAYPHDTSSFTQGLVYYNAVLYESTGNPNNASNNGSWIGPVEITTGQQTKKVTLPSSIFGEGITILNDKVYQITWQNKKGFVYDLKTFKQLQEFSYNHEGWGITHNGSELIVSDGSSNLYFWDTATLKELRRISIQDQNGLRNNINELEFINGFLYANVWQSNDILKIDPATGNVVGILDLSSLKQTYPDLVGESSSDKVLNGIAWDSSANRLFVTGKNWSKLFELKLN